MNFKKREEVFKGVCETYETYEGYIKCEFQSTRGKSFYSKGFQVCQNDLVLTKTLKLKSLNFLLHALLL